MGSTLPTTTLSRAWSTRHWLTMAGSTSCTIMPARRLRAISKRSRRRVSTIPGASTCGPTSWRLVSSCPSMRSAGRGVILNTSSSSGVLYDREMIAYTTTKHAVIAMTRQMAGDYGKHGVRVNALCPGWVDTPFNGPFIAQMGGRPQIEAYLRDKVPLGRWGTVGRNRRVHSVSGFRPVGLCHRTDTRGRRRGNGGLTAVPDPSGRAVETTSSVVDRGAFSLDP